MTLSPATFDEQLAFARREHASGSLAWKGLCQKFTRSGWRIPPLFGSAIAQWNGADPEDRFPGGHPDQAPLGSALCFAGGKYGHIMPTARAFANGNPAAWSNDLVKVGRIDKVDRNAPVHAWGHRYLGYLLAVNDYDLRAPQRRRYGGIAKAIDRLEAAHDTAVAQSDDSDAKVLAAEIARLKKMYDDLRRV